MITKVLSIIEKETGLKCYPLITDAIGDCIVYTFEPVSDDGIKQQNRLTLRIITKHIPEAMRANALIRSALLTIGDYSKVNEILDCAISGGGNLYDKATQTYHNIYYYYLTTKSEVMQ